MTKKIKLSEIMISLENRSDEYHTYLNLLTYELGHTISELDKTTSWGKDLKTFEEIADDENYLFLPTAYDLHEHQLMVKFSRTTSPEIEEHLLTALFKKGAFKNFNNLIRRFFLLDKWYAFRDKKIREFAINWCEQKNINYEE